MGNRSLIDVNAGPSSVRGDTCLLPPSILGAIASVLFAPVEIRERLLASRLLPHFR